MLKRIMRGCSLLAVVCSLSWSALALAGTRASVEVPAGELVAALKTLAKQSDVELLYQPEQLKDLRTAGVKGAYSAQEAVEILIKGMPLRVYTTERGVMVIAPAMTGSAEEGKEKMRVAEAAGGASAPGAEGGTAQKSEGRGAGEAEQGVKLEEVVVTAQKRAAAESIKDVPMSINAISGESLQKRGIGDVKELTFAVPSLAFHSFGAGGGFLNIRGIGGERGSSALVGLYLDDIPAESAFLLNGNTNSGLDLRTFDIERVEVLKGPQGTLFGESSVGGLVRYVTKDPKLDRVEGRVTGTFFGTQDGDPSEQVVGVFNVPLVNDVLGLRIAGTYEKNGGWIDQLANWNGPIMRRDINDNSLTDVRAKLLYVPTGALKVSALVDVHRNNVGGLNLVNVHPFSMSEFVQGSDHTYPTEGYDDFYIYNLTAQYNFGFATLLSSTSRFDSRIRSGNTQDPNTNLGAADQPEQLGFSDEVLVRPSNEGAFARMTSQELRLTSNSIGPAKWLIGGSWKKSRSLPGHSGGTDVLIPGRSLTFIKAGAGLSSDSSSEIAAGFTDGSYTFFDRLEIGGGVRVYHENQDVKSFGVNDVLTLHQSGTFKKTTYRVFAKYRLSDQMNFYANTATGFRSGIFNGQSAVAAGVAPAVTKPENSIFYEAGMKGAFFAKTLSLDFALFRGRYKDQFQGQVSAPYAWYENGGTANIKGIEWQVGVVTPISRLKFNLGGDILRSVYTKINPLAAGNAFIVDDPMDFVPKYDLTFTTDYAFDWGSSMPGFINVSYSRKGPMQHTNRNTGLGLFIDQSVPTDLLQASLGATINGFEFSLFARNILDERKALNPSWAGVWSQERPRSLGVSVAKSF